MNCWNKVLFVVLLLIVSGCGDRSEGDYLYVHTIDPTGAHRCTQLELSSKDIVDVEVAGVQYLLKSKVVSTNESYYTVEFEFLRIEAGNESGILRQLADFDRGDVAWKEIVKGFHVRGDYFTKSNDRDFMLRFAGRE